METKEQAKEAALKAAREALEALHEEKQHKARMHALEAAEAAFEALQAIGKEETNDWQGEKPSHIAKDGSKSFLAIKTPRKRLGKGLLARTIPGLPIRC